MASRMTHGPAIKVIRKSLGIRQDNLAEQAQVSASYLSRVENGLETPLLNATTTRLAVGLGVPIAAITYPIGDSTTSGTMAHGPAIRVIRKALGISQDFLAAQAKIGGSRLSRIENGRDVAMDTATAKRLAKGLGVDVAAITYPMADPSLLRESA